MNPQYKESEIESTFESARPRVVFASSAHTTIVDDVLAKLAGARPMTFVVGEALESWISFSDGLGAISEAGRLTKFDGAMPALWLYSSGSTGGSKKISRTRAQLTAETVGFHATASTDSEDVFLCAVPLSHAHGLGNGLLASTFVGATLIVQARFDRRRFLRSVESDRVTIVPGSPFMFKMLSETKMDREPDLGSIRLCFSAGAPLTHETYVACRDRFGLLVRQLYGTTETGSAALNVGADLDATWASVGPPVAGVEIGAFDDDGRLLPPGEEGAIGIKSPAMFDRYEIEELNLTSLRSGRFFAGDRGRVDADGRVFLTGRDTLFINLSGNKVDPGELETLLAEHPKVVEAIALGVVQNGNEVVKAVVVANESCEPGELLAFCRGRIADFKLPRIIEFRDEIPRNPLGKVLRKYMQ
jgi:long-chain acyl-CoA synthetase